jgi:peptide/nickel transport system permease protein
MAGVVITALVVLTAVLAPVISPYPPNQQDLSHIFSGFSSQHLLGTDELGRDELSRLLWAGRIDLTVAVLAVLFPFTFGTLLGTVAGYYGGWVDGLVGRAIEVLLALPFLVFVIAIVFVVGPGLVGIYIAYAVVDWVFYARIVRSSTLVVRESDYVAAAKVGGLSDLRILFRHVLPNTISQAIVYMMSDIVLVIVVVVTLSYIGLGVQPPTSDWGTMMKDGFGNIYNSWSLVTLPGIAVVITGLGFALIGDGLADLLRQQ